MRRLLLLKFYLISLQIEDCFKVLIETERLYMRPVEMNGINGYVDLYQDPEGVAMNADGQTKSAEWVTDHITNRGINSFQKKSCLGIYSVFKQDDNTFIGYFSLLPQQNPGEIEVGLLLLKRFHGQRFGSEIANAIREYIFSLLKNGYSTEEHPIKALTSTAHPDNIASWTILERMGMQFMYDGFIRESFPRKFYRFDLISND